MLQNSKMVCPEEYEYNQATNVFASQVLYQLCSWLTIHEKNIIISATSGSNKWDRSDRYSTVILCKAEDFDVLGLTISGEETDPQASSAITNCEPEHGKPMEACGNYVGLGSWVMRSVSSKLYAKDNPSQIMAGDYEVVCVDVSWCIPQNHHIGTTTNSMILCVPWVNWRGWIIKMGVLGVRRLNSLIDFPVSLCSWSERLFFSSPFTIVRIVRVATNICESCHSDTVPSNSAMFFCCAWTAWSGGKSALRVGFLLTCLHWSSASTCASNSRMLGDVSLPRRFRSSIRPCSADSISWLHMYRAPGYDVLDVSQTGPETGHFRVLSNMLKPRTNVFLCMHLSCANTPGKETNSSKAKKAKRENQTS